MYTTLTEMSVNEAFYPVMQAKTNVQSQLVKLFQVKTARYGDGEKYGVRRRVKQLTAKQSTQKPPEVTGVENGNMFRIAECGEKRQRKNIMCLQRKNVTFEKNRGKSVHTQHGADHWAAPRRKRNI